MSARGRQALVGQARKPDGDHLRGEPRVVAGRIRAQPAAVRNLDISGAAGVVRPVTRRGAHGGHFCAKHCARATSGSHVHEGAKGALNY